MKISFFSLSKQLRIFREKGDLDNVIFIKNLSPENFYILLNNSKCIIGNSSVGIREGAYLGIPCLNIGNRQKGRLISKSVVNSDGSLKSLKKSFKIIKKMNFSKNSKIFKNPYDNNKYLSEYLVQVISKINKNYRTDQYWNVVWYLRFNFYFKLHFVKDTTIFNKI